MSARLAAVLERRDASAALRATCERRYPGALASNYTLPSPSPALAALAALLDKRKT